jgi:hypothetical protein
MFHQAGGTGHLTRLRWNLGPNGQPFTLSMRVPTLTSVRPLSRVIPPKTPPIFQAREIQKTKGVAGWAADEKGVKTKPKKTNGFLNTHIN